MSCDCNSALSCTSEGLAACVRKACDDGYVVNSWWQTLENAQACAQEWTAKTCAERWNALPILQGSPLHYEAKMILPRLFSPNAWQVVVKRG